jgi:hypothetical protein
MPGAIPVLEATALRPKRLQQTIPVLAGFALMFALRFAAERMTGPIGIVPLVFLASALLSAVWIARGKRPGALPKAAKLVVGLHAVVLCIFAPLWVGHVDRAGLLVLLLPILIYAGWALVRVASEKSGDARLVRAIAAFAPERMAPLIATELRLLGMALFAWGPARRDLVAPAFTSGLVLVPVLLSLAALSAVEVTVLHLLLSQWNATLALWATAFGVLTLVYFVGLAKSLKYLPSRLDRDKLLVRLGHFHSFELPYEAIVEASLAAPGLPAQPGTINLALMSSPNVLIDLNETRSVLGLNGRRREFHRVALRMDDPYGFLLALRQRIAPAALSEEGAASRSLATAA